MQFGVQKIDFIPYFLCLNRLRKELEISTRGQGDNSAWSEARRGKVTASIIGTIYTMRPITDPSRLVKQINTTTDLSHVAAIRHGRKNEIHAKEHYEKIENVKINDRGFMLHPTHHWLGASTDGFISTPPTAVEIKCPLGDPDTKSIMELARKRKNWFMETNGEGMWLKKNHKYFYQCQMQMECLEVSECIFIVYLCTEAGVFQDMHSERIRKDEKLVHNLISKAQLFYNNNLKI